MDYQVIMALVNGNLAEGDVKKKAVPKISSEAPPSVPLTSTVSESTQVVVAEQLSNIMAASSNIIDRKADTSESKVGIFLRFTFSMEQLVISLSTGGSKSVSFIFV